VAKDAINNTLFVITEDLKKGMHYLVTLGGDGTILYAAKQFSGDFIPPIVSFGMVGQIISLIVN
jgi:NAD kinase